MQSLPKQSDLLFLYKKWSRQLFTLQLPQGSITMMPCPPGGTDHVEFAKFLKLKQIDVVVSLLQNEESIDLGLNSQPSDLDNQDIEYINFPIQDHNVPQFVVPFKSLVIQLEKLIKHDKNIAVHCYAGIGRTGILSASLMIHLGYDVDTSLIKLSQARKLRVPETLEQITWLHRYEKEL